MQFFKRAISLIFSAYAFLVFLLLMFLLFPFVVIASFFGKIRGGNMIYAICRFWADTAFFLWGIHHQNIYEAPLQKQQAVVFVFNHISYFDIPSWLKAIRHQHIRVLGKAEMTTIPIFGYIYRKGAILVNREDAEQRKHSVQELKYYLAKNISVVIAPEGTFNLSNRPLKFFYNGAFKIAIETQTAIQPVIFPRSNERMDRKHALWLSPGKSEAVFLKEIKTTGLTLNDVENLKQKVYNVMEDALIRYKANWIQ